MRYECRLDPVIHKFSVKNAKEAVTEAAALELEYVKICGACREFTVCIYIHILLEPEGCSANMIGASVVVSSSTVINELIYLLLKYAFVVTSNTSTGMSVFYVMKEHSLGVYYLLCRDVGVEWRGYEPVDYEEVRGFIME